MENSLNKLTICAWNRIILLVDRFIWRVSARECDGKDLQAHMGSEKKKKKKKNEAAQRTEEICLRLARMEEDLSGYRMQLADMQQQLTQQLREAEEENAKTIRRQSGSLEDVLEELQRQGEEKDEISERIRELKERESALAGLCCLLMGQNEMIMSRLLKEGALPEDVRSGWLRQAQMMDQESETLKRQCTIQTLGRCGEKVDYDCHEILTVLPTATEEQQGTVAQVFARGYTYQGHVLQKAKVAAYRYEGSAAPCGQQVHP